VITDLLVGIAGPTTAAALAFSLAAIGAVSLLLSWLASKRGSVTIEAKRIRLFKEESRGIPIEMRSGSSNWMSLSSMTFRSSSGVGAALRRNPDGSTELVITPRLAGRSDRLVAAFEEVDALGMFAYRKEVDLDLVVESLPIALRTPAEPLKVSPISTGENPAGVVGTGQELFAVAEYQTGLDTRDIMWKRAARMSDDRLPMRVREANVRKVVTVGLAVGWRSEDERAARVDLIAEALARLCKGMLLIGTTIEVDYVLAGQTRSIRISNLTELADALVGPWSASEGAGSLQMFARGVDLLIIGPEEANEVSRQAQLHPGRLLVLSDLPSGAQLPRGALEFTGNEDLRGMAAEVLAR
jgi:hypothetical protein